MDGEAWRATVHKVTKSWTHLKRFSMHTRNLWANQNVPQCGFLWRELLVCCDSARQKIHSLSLPTPSKGVRKRGASLHYKLSERTPTRENFGLESLKYILWRLMTVGTDI